MRRVKSKERKAAGKIYCSHCKPLKVDAVWRKAGIHCNHHDGYACEDHKHLIPVDKDDGHMTEADHQTWGRL